MPGLICLVGGEEFRVGCEEMDREIMAASGGKSARVVVIPTAAVTGPATKRVSKAVGSAERSWGDMMVSGCVVGFSRTRWQKGGGSRVVFRRLRTQ